MKLAAISLPILLFWAGVFCAMEYADIPVHRMLGEPTQEWYDKQGEYKLNRQLQCIFVDYCRC